MADTEDPACKIDITRRNRREGSRSLQEAPASPSKEWDQCVRKGTLTVGAGMAAGMFLGMIMGMGIPLVWGLGAGALWSVKRCRALMRDGIMTPEQKRAKKEEKVKERREARRSLADADRKSKESKKSPATPTPEPKKKGGKKQEVLEDNHECCKKLKDLLEKQKQKECELLKKIEKGLEGCEKMDKSIKEQGKLCKEDSSSKSTSTSKINFKATTTVKLFVPQSPAFRTRITANGTDVCMCMIGKDGKMETCPSCACLCSSKNEFEEPKPMKLLNEEIKEGIDNIEKLNFPEPQAEVKENQNFDEVEPLTEIQAPIDTEDEENRKNPSDLLILQDVSSTYENESLEEDGDYEDEQNPTLILEELPNLIDEDIEEEVIEIKGDHFEVIIEEVEDDSGDEDDDPGIPEPEVPRSEVEEGLTQQLTNMEEECNAEELDKEEVIFVETYKSESWPFSFTLPSLDKFHKKSPDSAFKWPPLPSSIIVKPRKDPTCTCEGSTNPQEQGDTNLPTKPMNFEVCSCGYPQSSCKCNEQDDT
ncbi:hypothetical protein GE061_015262 [Apolygus lucorum]|uniref:Uncharacterized protein n=1 Tax=Apolygus lucorum TaxID=248454 RepID=A0A6A4JA73_APOLU|nr:hypothetical protein GE061_015262 [Apolygus lucorum]